MIQTAVGLAGGWWMRPDEPFGIPFEGLSEHHLTLVDDLQYCGREQANAAVMGSVLYQEKKTWQKPRAS